MTYPTTSFVERFQGMSSLFIIGTGPGALSHLTEGARSAISASGTIVGYASYIDSIAELLSGKEIVSTPMTREAERCRIAIDLAISGKNVALVSGGDAGIYGMAGLLFELLEREYAGEREASLPDIEVIPGVSAIQAAAAALGAPLMHDFSVISLSDLLTPWEKIKKRLHAAAAADFVIVLFNPKSMSRTFQIEEAREIILSYRSGGTPTGIVRNASRNSEEVTVTVLERMLEHSIDMSSIVIVGNSETFIDHGGRMVTPRGYARKFAGGRASATGAGHPFTGRAVMFCGTASDVGKSVITAGFCRYLVNSGIKAAPFKSQNMSLNSFVTPEGGEIGRAQAAQAEACRVPAHTDMNPVLLKPGSDRVSQVIVQGKVAGKMNAREYDEFKPTLLPRIRESYGRLSDAHDFIVLEGAGSIAEINLRESDIANLKMAEMADCPAILVADIDRGGVFAQIIGTVELLKPDERKRIRGIIINKFRGDISILVPGIEYISNRTGIPLLGVLPFIPDIRIPDEDSVSLAGRFVPKPGDDKREIIRVGVIKLPRISNFTDFDPLRQEDDLELSYIDDPASLDELDLVIIPGSKATIPDLEFLENGGWRTALSGFKGRIIGICGGYQMLGDIVSDPLGVESERRYGRGMGLIPIDTTLAGDKKTHQIIAELYWLGAGDASLSGSRITGYEIHMGESSLPRGSAPFARIVRRGDQDVDLEDGFVSSDGRLIGTYIHGVFENDAFRKGYFDAIRIEKGIQVGERGSKTVSADPFDIMASHLSEHLDMRKLMEICGLQE